MVSRERDGHRDEEQGGKGRRKLGQRNNRARGKGKENTFFSQFKQRTRDYRFIGEMVSVRRDEILAGAWTSQGVHHL